jgi:hypothetical protein
VNETRSALIVASTRYRDPKLRRLRSPAQDARELAGVLGDPGIGGFDVDVSVDEPEHLVRRRLAGFFKTRGRDDLLLLHFSCHGVKDEDGNLYFATPDTELDHLDATAVPAEFVNRLMDRSPSRRIVLLLDCCYAGAFGRGSRHRAGAGVELKERFDGRGRVVLTASNSMEYAFEGDTLKGEGTPSVFTSALVAGLTTGEADRDRDGFVSIDELYEYLYDHVREATPNQTPSKWTYDLQGELVVARSPAGAVLEPAELPDALVHALESPIPHVREGTVHALADLLRGHNPPLALAARLALEQLREDDSRRVSVAAVSALGAAEPAPPPPAAAPAAAPAPRPAATAPSRPDPARPEPARAAPASRTPRLVLAAAAAAALLLLLAVVPVLVDDAAVRSARGYVAGWLALALLLPLVALAWWSRRLRPELAAGLLTGLAAHTTGAAVGWAGASGSPSGVFIDPDSAFLSAPSLRLLLPLAALALLAAALRALAAAGGRGLLSRDARTGRGHAGIALAGAVLCVAGLGLPLRNEIDDRHGILAEPALDVPWVAFEPLVALAAVVALAAAGILRRGSPAVRAGALVALGVALVVYFTVHIVAIHLHAAGSYGPGAILGVFGGIGIAAAGLQLRGEDARRAGAA